MDLAEEERKETETESPFTREKTSLLAVANYGFLTCDTTCERVSEFLQKGRITRAPQSTRKARFTLKIPGIEKLSRKVSSKKNGLTCNFKHIA